MNSKETITSVCKKILRKIGQNPDERIDEFDQDPEYTSCRVEELQEYFNLYQKNSTTIKEKKVLCCFMLECLNEEIQSGRTHILQDKILTQLFKDKEMHKKELEYWMNTSDPDEENWWPITKVLLKYI